MVNILTTLTRVAVTIYRAVKQSENTDDFFGDTRLSDDAVLQKVRALYFAIPPNHEAIHVAEEALFKEEDFSVLQRREGEPDAVLMPPDGVPISSQQIVIGLLFAPFMQIYLLRLSDTEDTYVRAVLEGFEELRCAVRGESIRAYQISGFAGVKLAEGTMVTTPWGVLRPAPGMTSGFSRLQSGSILAEEKRVSLKVQRSPKSEHTVDPSELRSNRSSILFPLAFALTSKEGSKPTVPMSTFSLLLLPVQAGFTWGSTSVALQPLRFYEDFTARINELEKMAGILEAFHCPSVDIAARRLLSSIAHRTDQSDSLIDAVVVWESLVGTSTEVTFRVTAALTKALETNRTKRRDLRKGLSKVYDIRSRIVHGAAVEPKEVAEATTTAIDVAVRVLRDFYRRGPEWLAASSNDRAEMLLLEEP